MAFGKFGKYYPGEVDRIPADFDLVAALREDLALVRAQHQGEDRIEFDAPPGALPVRTDRKHLRYIVVNLLQNAVKYSTEEVRMAVVQENGRAVIEISDRGIGIPAEEVDELFSPFYRASNVGDRPGTGMGLAIVKKSARLIDAALSLEQREGGGTRFRISLPL